MNVLTIILAILTITLVIVLFRLRATRRSRIESTCRELHLLVGQIGGTVADTESSATRSNSLDPDRMDEAWVNPLARTFDGLDVAVDELSHRLRRELRTLRQDREMLVAILSSMAQGVVALDTEERVMSMNPSAASILGTRQKWALGRLIQAVLRNPALLQFVARTVRSDSLVEEEIDLPNATSAGKGDRSNGDGGDRIVVARGKGLHDASGKRIGALLVLNDITRLRRLEQVRQDFVANVSHELRTPIAAIKGSIETLLDGSNHDPDSLNRFLQLIARQSDRLHATLEDLLSLARLESIPGPREVERLPIKVVQTIREAVEACQIYADSRSTEMDTKCDPTLVVPANAAMLEQALINLIENAIKYSPDRSTVRIEAEVHPAVIDNDGGETKRQELTISVIDEGIGIPRDHQARIFERFYRVDKGRSRAVGGTGLGLSIVKHIALAHGGRVSVASEPGRGSAFRMHLPIENV